MSTKTGSWLQSHREMFWFFGGGALVGVILNLALHVRPYDIGGISGGILSALLLYLLA